MKEIEEELKMDGWIDYHLRVIEVLASYLFSSKTRPPIFSTAAETLHTNATIRSSLCTTTLESSSAMESTMDGNTTKPSAAIKNYKNGPRMTTELRRVGSGSRAQIANVLLRTRSRPARIRCLCRRRLFFCLDILCLIKTFGVNRLVAFMAG